MTEASQGKALYKRIWFWGLVLAVVYALAGFVALPWWLARIVPERAAQHLGWQTQVADINVNPFAMTVEVIGLNAADADATVVSFDRFAVDLTLWRLVTGVIAFDSIELEEPHIRLDLLDDHSVNFARDWQSHNPPSAAAETDAEPEAPGAPPKLHVTRIQVMGGDLLFRDFSQPEHGQFTVSPLDLTLTDLATFSRDGEDSRYTLEAVLGDQRLAWQGELSITPLYSRGHLTLENVGHDTLAHFLQQVFPYRLLDGRLSLASDYELVAGETFSLVTSAGELTLSDFALALPQAEDEAVVSLAGLAVDNIRFSLAEAYAGVGTVTLDGLAVTAERDAEGLLNLLQPLSRSADHTNESAPEANSSDGADFQWEVDTIRLNDSQVTWRDAQLATPATLALADVQFELARLSHRLAEPLPYQFQARLVDGGRLHARGQLTLQPFNLEAGVSAADVVLAQFEPYVQSGAALAIRDGRVSLDGDLDLDGQQEPMTGTFSGRGEVSALDITLQDSDEPLLAWQTLRLAPIEYNLAPARLEIGTVSLAAPRVDLTRLTSGAHNVEMIATAADAPEDGATPEDAESGSGLVFRIGEFQLQDGNLAYTDRTVSPVFATRVSELTGSVTGLSNVAPQQGTVAIRGRVGEFGQLDFTGALGALGGDDSSELNLALSQLSLPVLSPYFGRYLGYGVDSGKMALALDYQFTGSHLRAENLVTFDQLELGQAVESEKAVNAPIALGLALLRDNDGVIEIDIPVEGDLDDPQFRVSRVVMRAFVNLLVKAAASPFNMLGSVAELAGLSGEELGQVRFVPGEVALAEEETKKLAALANALKQRDNLMLNVRGAVSPALDGLALKQARLYQRLGVAADAPLDAQIDALEGAFVAAQGPEALAALRSEHGGDSLAGGRWQALLLTRLAASSTLPPETLGNLAVARGGWLQRQLLEQYGIPASQLFLRDPVLTAPADSDGLVTVEFSLDAR
ncbi:DUF748 domain-containing protein [Marinobacter sp. SS21]|uniref:DUF748 domain-containing protein n=1 Tax=Marinobacter sp. SS21 TaxID=2979460 RepID=UPI002331159A|nr:DUF748 domain-containing protein [Marinobacter sp. SS21]MDC0661100.1 DUF748 domain-containing protein [Marinobacter sp. SS21]